MWVDTHCHLNNEKLVDCGGADACVNAAKSNGVSAMVSISSRVINEFPSILEIAQRHDNVWCTVGTHPHDVSLPEELAVTQQDLVQIANSSEKVIGFGESGLDYFYNYGERDDQISSFRKHIRAAMEADLPLVVHARDADEDIIRIIKEETSGKVMRGVMHCFSSSKKMAEEALELGYYISFSGIVTFKKAADLREIAKTIPHNRLLVETDSPYLAPEPFRGKINQPAWVARTGEVLAETLNIPPHKFAEITTNNFYTLFSKAIR